MKMQKLETHINCHVKMDQSLNEMRTCHGTALCILSTVWNKIVCIRCGEIAGLLLSVQMNCIPRETTYWNETKPQQKRTHESRHSVHILFPLYFSFSFETIYEIKESNFILLAVMSSNDDCLSNVKHSHPHSNAPFFLRLSFDLCGATVSRNLLIVWEFVFAQET